MTEWCYYATVTDNVESKKKVQNLYINQLTIIERYIVGLTDCILCPAGWKCDSLRKM